MKKWIRNNKVLAFLLALVLIMLVVLLVAVETSRAPAPPADGGNAGNEAPISVEMTIEGEVVCLPHKDTSGPQTLECAYGVKLDDGTYYGLQDSNENYENISALPTGKRARLTGTLKTEPSEIYQSTGTFTFTKSEVID